jgi:hypothetical protein
LLSRCESRFYSVAKKRSACRIPISMQRTLMIALKRTCVASSEATLALRRPYQTLTYSSSWRKFHTICSRQNMIYGPQQCAYTEGMPATVFPGFCKAPLVIRCRVSLIAVAMTLSVHLATRVIIGLVIALCMLASSVAEAQQAPRPIPRNPKESCPYGYISSGGYCTPSSNKSKYAVPRSEKMRCPYGYYSSGNACVASSPKSRDAIPRVGQCPYGYHASGDYCLKSGRQ